MDLRLNGDRNGEPRAAGGPKPSRSPLPMRLISMRAALPPMLQASCSTITRKRTGIFPGRAMRRDGRPQWFDLVRGLGCHLAAQLCYSRIQQERVPGGRRGATFRWPPLFGTRPRKGGYHDVSAQKNCSRWAIGPGRNLAHGSRGSRRAGSLRRPDLVRTIGGLRRPPHASQCGWANLLAGKQVHPTDDSAIASAGSRVEARRAGACG